MAKVNSVSIGILKKMLINHDIVRNNFKMDGGKILKTTYCASNMSYTFERIGIKNGKRVIEKTLHSPKSPLYMQKLYTVA